jgi:hypothetical protein
VKWLPVYSCPLPVSKPLWKEMPLVFYGI